MSNYQLTEKQIQIVSAIQKHHIDHAEDIDMDQLLAEIPYQTSKESMQFSLRALVKKGVVVKREAWAVRRGRARRTYGITTFGKTVLGIEA